jgi:hypothetical protein
MKRTAVLMAFVLLSGVVAFANSNSDPRIIIKDPICDDGETCTPVGTHFSFTSPKGGSGTLGFLNNSEINWHNLELVESGVPASEIDCTTDLFRHCSVTTVGGITTILASGVGQKFRGIPAGTDFFIEFDGWPAAGVSFKGVANVPEPATLALFATGLGAIVTRRRKLLGRF